jgi:hypothetical protein
MCVVKKEKSISCETCGETNPDKLLKTKPFCYRCKNREYRINPSRIPMIKIDIPDGVEDPLVYYKKEYSKIHYLENKERFKIQRKRYKSINLLKKYCIKLNRDANDYLKPDLTLNEIIEINESLRPLVYPPKEPKEPRTCFYCLRKKVTYHYNLRKFLCTQHYKQKDVEYIAEQELKKKNKELYLDPVRYKEHLTSEFIKKIEGKFGSDVLDFSLLDYVNKDTHVELICKKNNHTFKVVPTTLLKVNVNACPVCATDKNHTVNKYINLAIEKYGDQFDYSLVNYVSKRLPVTIKCNKHDLLFDQILYTHSVLGSIGCPDCHVEKTNKKKPGSTTGTIICTPRKKSTEYKIKNNVRKRIRDAIKRKYPTEYITPTEEILGCKIEAFREHLESKFEPWMTWENYGLYNGEFNYGWDIDHITPLSQANTVEGIYELNHYENLQPLCSKINRDIKSSRLDFEHSEIPEI